MKFVVIARPAGHEPEPDHMVGILERFRTWMQQQITDGRIDAAYLLAEGGGVTICNADSAEELMELLLGSPPGALFRYEAHPLANFDTGMERAITALREAHWGPHHPEHREVLSSSRN